MTPATPAVSAAVVAPAARRAMVVPTPAVARDVAAGEWVLSGPPVVCYDFARDVAFTIPSGFRCDLASIPRLARAAIDKEDLGVAGPLVHDRLYRAGGDVDDVEPSYSRAQADRLFLDLMTADGVARWRRWAAYTLVRACGAASWRGDGARVQRAMRPLTPPAPTEGPCP